MTASVFPQYHVNPQHHQGAYMSQRSYYDDIFKASQSDPCSGTYSPYMSAIKLSDARMYDTSGSSTSNIRSTTRQHSNHSGIVPRRATQPASSIRRTPFRHNSPGLYGERSISRSGMPFHHFSIPPARIESGQSAASYSDTNPVVLSDYVWPPCLELNANSFVQQTGYSDLATARSAYYVYPSPQYKVRPILLANTVQSSMTVPAMSYDTCNVSQSQSQFSTAAIENKGRSSMLVPLTLERKQEPSPSTSRQQRQCFDHGCNGRMFSTLSNLHRHQREKSGMAVKSTCPHCGTHFTRTTAMKGHISGGKCQGSQDVNKDSSPASQNSFSFVQVEEGFCT